MNEANDTLGTPALAHAAIRPEACTLEGRWCRLRPLDPARDAAGLYQLSHTPQALAGWNYLPYGPFTDLAAFQTWMEANSRSTDPLFFAIEVDAKIVGQASLLRIAPEQRSVEVGHILYTPALQRTCAATEAMYLLARHIFETLGYRRYEWKCNALNAPSREAALRYGFSFEGLFRQHMIVKGRNRDTAWYSMLDREWSVRKAAFEAWLSPDNFDAQGKQRVSLGVLHGQVSAEFPIATL